jgi:DNA-binding NtrC family response regulator
LVTTCDGTFAYRPEKQRFQDWHSVCSKEFDYMTSVDTKTRHNDGQVLVVDDEEGIRQFIGDILDRDGIPCVLAGTVEEALEALGNHKISLTLLDWGLRGGMDTSGAVVLEYCKERFPMLPVIVMSGMPIDVRTDATTKQADGFLAKPFNATLIVAHVNQWLNRIKRTPKSALPERGEDIIPLNKLESRYIRHVVQLLNDDVSLAAARLGISPQAIEAALQEEDAAV